MKPEKKPRTAKPARKSKAPESPGPSAAPAIPAVAQAASLPKTGSQPPQATASPKAAPAPRKSSPTASVKPKAEPPPSAPIKTPAPEKTLRPAQAKAAPLQPAPVASSIPATQPVPPAAAAATVKPVPAPAAPLSAKAAPVIPPAKGESPKTGSAKAAKPLKDPKVSKAKERTFNIPPILLEGDTTPGPKTAGPGSRYALAPGASARQVASVLSPGELPAGYGTRRLFLTARDPRWLYASWDLTVEQQHEYNLQSRLGHLVLRVFANDEVQPVVPDVHLNPESRTWFINVPRPETRYRAELGFPNAAGVWKTISTSPTTFTPPDAPTPAATAVEFATIPAQVSFQQVVEKVQEFVTEHRPLLEAVLIAQATQPAPVTEPAKSPRTASEQGPEPASPTQPKAADAEPSRPPKRKPDMAPHRDLPIRIETSEAWTPERVAALTQLIHIDSYRRVWMGSIEITELVRRQLAEEVSSIAAAELARSSARTDKNEGLEFGISSRAELAMPKARKFWFKVNAELILYGATEADAEVTIAGRTVKLRPDGTFSFRFALPDGRYDLPAVARSADGHDTRAAILEFTRATEYRGHVGAHPQDGGLKAPRGENL